MVFNSFSFLLFFPLVTIIYFLLPHKYRWLHLLNAIGSRGDNLLQALAGFDADFVQALEADRRDPDAPQEREPL